MSSAGSRLTEVVPGLRQAAGTPFARFTVAVTLAVATSFLSGCDRLQDSQAIGDVEIRLDVPDDPAGATVTLSGLPPAVAGALRNASLERDDWTSLLRVTVHQPNGDTVNTPPVLGAYEVGENDVVRFRPMFPFDPGREYQVVFDPAVLPGAGEAEEAGTPAVVIVEVPRPEVDPTTVVSHVFPSGTRFPENQLKLYIAFSAPMSAVDGLEHIRLLDSSGRQVEAPFLPLGTEFWDYDHQRYTVFFDPGRVKQGILPNEQLGRPLTAGERYTLVVDPTWPDAEGSPLKEGFRKEFTVGQEDMTPLDPDTWRLRVPAAGTTQRLVVSFPEPLDHELLARALAIEDSRGRRLEGDVEITNWETRWSFSPARPWSAGAHSLVALSILEDLAGNRIGVPFEIDVFERIDEPTEQESYRISFDVGGG